MFKVSRSGLEVRAQALLWPESHASASAAGATGLSAHSAWFAPAAQPPCVAQSREGWCGSGWGRGAGAGSDTEGFHFIFQCIFNAFHLFSRLFSFYFIHFINYESQLCWAELPRLLNEVKYSNTGGEERFAGS